MAGRVSGLHEGFSAKDISAFGLSRLRKQRADENRGKGFAMSIQGMEAFRDLLNALPKGPGRAIMRKALRKSLTRFCGMSGQSPRY